jgi:YihY family inner membrane protein
MPWNENAKVVALRERITVVDVVIGTYEGFVRHLTARNVAVLAYYGVLTIFPLLMAATTILGFVLEDNPDLQEDIIDSAIGQFPVIGNQIQDNAGQITGSYWALVIGLVIALWSSMKAFLGLETALDDTWEVPVLERAAMPIRRLRALVGIAVIGLAQLSAVALAAIVAQAGLPALGNVGLTVGGAVINAAVTATMYRFLTSADVAWRDVWPGALFCAVLFTVLQFLGTKIMTEALASAEQVYGTFASILALMTWISLYALIALVGAELNAELVRRRDGGTAREIGLGADAPAATEPV